jgi:hypothetical protein
MIRLGVAALIIECTLELAAEVGVLSVSQEAA